jgi:integrase
MALQRVSRVLRLCATKWRDEDKQLWLARPPLIEMLEDDPREPYPLSFVEQRIFFQQLAPHLAPMALFKVNTGTRDQEVCKLRWDWEIDVPELNTSVFLIPKKFGGRRPNSGVKNRTERLVILNRVAKSIVDEQRGIHPLYVFPHKGKYLQRMNENGWKQARKRAALAYEAEMGEEPHPGFKNIRVHDLKHTYGRRLRAAGVAFEDRQVLLGHKSRNVTEHYSSAEIGHLLEQAEKILTLESSSPTLTVIRRRHF